MANIGYFTGMRDMIHAMRELSAGCRWRDSASPSTTSARQPVAFQRYEDPAGRFKLGYPSSWTLQTHHGVHVSSPRLGSFVRVEVLPASAALWTHVEQALADAGISATIVPCDDQHVRGTLVVAPTRFAWEAWAYPCGEERLILSVGSVLDRPPSGSLLRYEDRVLKAIRKSFRVRR